MLKPCPKCNKLPVVEYSRPFLARAEVYCPKCHRTTGFYEAFWVSDASNEAKEAWNNDNVEEGL